MLYVKASTFVIIVIYAMVAFANWDLAWVAQVPEWTSDERGALAFLVVMSLAFINSLIATAVDE